MTYVLNLGCLRFQHLDKLLQEVDDDSCLIGVVSSEEFRHR